MTKRTRYKISIVAGLILFSLAAMAIYKEMDSVAVTAIGAVMTIMSSYIWGETKRPSSKE